jgi:hypothetical protein
MLAETPKASPLANVCDREMFGGKRDAGAVFALVVDGSTPENPYWGTLTVAPSARLVPRMYEIEAAFEKTPPWSYVRAVPAPPNPRERAVEAPN